MSSIFYSIENETQLTKVNDRPFLKTLQMNVMSTLIAALPKVDQAESSRMTMKLSQSKMSLLKNSTQAKSFLLKIASTKMILPVF